MSTPNSIRFAPFGQAPRAPEGRLFELAGAYEPDALDSAISFLMNDASHIYKGVEHTANGLRIVLQRNIGWRLVLPLHGDTPPAIDVIHEKVGEVGPTTVLGYTLFVLCAFLDWNPEEVHMGEMSPEA